MARNYNAPDPARAAAEHAAWDTAPDDHASAAAKFDAATVEARIRGAYTQCCVTAGTRTVRLADLRAALAGTAAADIDRVLDRMGTSDGIHIRSESDQKALSDRDREAAIVLGGTARHTILIEPGW
ncbi:hypothetical protein [Nocardia wallacei]|uniref:hypothetical protein n=1 Tax=Nocardia wallacei TaxID=480035 RepID=UPI00245378A9|nr:hypothetical protein [Nocardia wallacei]